MEAGYPSEISVTNWTAESYISRNYRETMAFLGLAKHYAKLLN
jgi:hypothetical protein